MTLKFKQVALVLAAVAALALQTQAAEAGDYAALTIRNPTSNTIYYQIKWGDGAWKSVSLEPYTKMHHWVELDESGEHPIPYVRFDCVGGDGGYTERLLRLYCYETDFPRSGGKKYVFRYTGRYHLDLYAE